MEYILLQCVQYKHNYKLILSSFGVIVVGIGSFVFHGTMKRTKMLDEIPMLWCSLFIYTSLSLFSFSNPSCTKGSALCCCVSVWSIQHCTLLVALSISSVATL